MAHVWQCVLNLKGKAKQQLSRVKDAFLLLQLTRGGKYSSRTEREIVIIIEMIF